MAKKKQKIPKKKQKSEKKSDKKENMFEQHKIRECQVKLVRLSIDCPVFAKALFKELGIRNCSVRLDRLIESKKKSCSEKLRSQVSWLPTVSSVMVNSSEARALLAVYQEKNHIKPSATRKNVIRKRAKSMFENRTNDDAQSNDMNGMERSKDIIPELQKKFNSPNFGLKPSCDRSLGPKQQQPLTGFQKMFEEYKKRVESKLAKK